MSASPAPTQTKRSVLNFLNKELGKIPSNTPLQEWLEMASKISPEVSKALDGIYCGREGKIIEELEFHGKTVVLTMGWYTVLTAKVEYAYFS